jgi:hypothetical protein
MGLDQQLFRIAMAAVPQALHWLWASVVLAFVGPPWSVNSIGGHQEAVSEQRRVCAPEGFYRPESDSTSTALMAVSLAEISELGHSPRA